MEHWLGIDLYPASYIDMLDEQSLELREPHGNITPSPEIFNTYRGHIFAAKKYG
jgi:hypothetical protein